MENLTESQDVRSHIYRIRGRDVMLDRNLAILYDVSVGRLNEAVKRNHQRFPMDFMFHLSSVEWENLKSQSAISSFRWGGARHAPYAFTEQGVAMISSVLHSEKAIQVNIAIMRAFVKLRHALNSGQNLKREIEKLTGRVNVHDTDIRLLSEIKSKTTSRTVAR